MQWKESLSMQDDKVDIIASIFRMAKSIERLCNRKFQTIGCTGSQSRILCFLLIATQHKDIYQKDIEKALNLKNPTVTGLLKRLDEKGFILIVPNNKDRRCKNVYLTEKAYDIQKRMEADRKKIDKTLLIGMNKKETENLVKMLERVLYNISEP